MPDKHFEVIVRDRLGLPVSLEGALCQHRRANGTLCNAPLDTRGKHARICPIGGGITKKHNRLRDWSGKEHSSRTAYSVEYEQRIPAWDETVTQEDGTTVVEQAILDWVPRDALTGREIHVDTTVTCAFSQDPGRLRARANKDGLAASQAAHGKRVRYSQAGGSLVPLAFEAGGRPADETVAFINGWQTASLGDAAATPISTVWQHCSTILQLGNAEQMLSALGSTVVPRASVQSTGRQLATLSLGSVAPEQTVRPANTADGPILLTASSPNGGATTTTDSDMVSSTPGPAVSNSLGAHLVAAAPWSSVTEWRDEPGAHSVVRLPGPAVAGGA